MLRAGFWTLDRFWGLAVELIPKSPLQKPPVLLCLLLKISGLQNMSLFFLHIKQESELNNAVTPSMVRNRMLSQPFGTGSQGGKITF